MKLILLFQILNSFLDVLALLCIGYVTLKLGNQEPAYSAPTKWLDKISTDQQIQNIFIVSLTATLFTFKTISSLWLNNKLVKILTAEADNLSLEILEETFYSNYEWIKGLNEENTIYTINQGPNAITNGVIGTAMSILNDLVLVCFILITLTIFNFQITIILVVLNLIVFAVFFPSLLKQNNSSGKKYAKTFMATQENLKNIWRSYKEIFVYQKESYFFSIFQNEKKLNSETYTQNVNSLNVTKTIIELALISTSLVFLSSILIIGNDNYISDTLLFLIGAFRIAPSLVRLQNNTIMLKYYQGRSESYKLLLTTIKKNKNRDNQKSIIGRGPTQAKLVNVMAQNLSFSYEESKKKTIQNMNFTIPSGSTVAVLGDSGSGKTTLMELLVGLLKPSEGYIIYTNASDGSQIPINEVKISYVPQNPVFFQGTLLQNVTFNERITKEDLVTLDKLWKIVELQHIADKYARHDSVAFLGSDLPLSGGEKQRIAIVRAMYAKPSILILDEALNAVSTALEKSILDKISAYTETTIFYVTHRTHNLERFTNKIVL